ncbi:hypothetical protein PAUR_a1562 [Pseudoalteromonas aurantia 208]|uniref:Uncharacterized protein n=1 Tax=Pseudoalteromonas aurantia 208 TaxID=1314867 RepID=A0ABR9EB51_9GAMM|nr:hypothetical protein [Pseudoalteromonas aurantia 208]
MRQPSTPPLLIFGRMICFIKHCLNKGKNIHPNELSQD